MNVNFIYKEELNSTNTYLESLSDSNELEEGTVVYTSKQIAGRGQGSNSWESADGENITMSLLLKPNFISAVEQFQLNKAVCVGVIQFLSQYIPNEQLYIKWPNDIYVNDSKIAGILIEHNLLGNVLDRSIIGIGLNVNQQYFESAPNPTSLLIETGNPYDIETVLKELVDSLTQAYKQIHKSIVFYDALYVSKLYRFGEYYGYIYKDDFYNAKILGVNNYGQLILDTEEGVLLTCNQKEIQYLI